jgi:hypothetical protein
VRSRQRLDRLDWLHPFSTPPVRFQLDAVLHRPLSNEPGGARRKIAVDELSGRDLYTRPVLPIERMKVRRRVVLDEHPDHDAIERR